MPAIPERLHAIPLHFDVPKDVRELARFIGHRAGYRDNSRDELATGIAIMCANAIMADRLANPVDTGREKALEDAASHLERRADEIPNTLTAIGVAKILRGEAASVRALANPENGRG